MGAPVKRDNCLSLVRMIAAVQVMLGHVLIHLDLAAPAAAVKILNFFQGVPIFFFLSGFLIWGSIGRSRDFREYAGKRFRRIYPELWLSVLVEIAVLLIFVPGVPAGTLALFAAAQGTVFQFWTPDALRAFGCGTPNGSLWTICVIIQFYLAAYPLYRWFHGKKTLWLLLALAVSCAIPLASPLLAGTLPEIAYKLYTQTLLPYLWLFLLGAAAAEQKERLLPILKRWWFVPLIVSFAVSLGGWDLNRESYGLLRCTCLTLGLLGFGYAFPRLEISWDFSYPLYLYHMIVVNILLSLGLQGRWRWGLLAVAVSCAAAYGSQQLVAAILRRIDRGREARVQ